ncbi:hypothetical protein [Streptomyces sp. NPDC127084]|uniref:hypothetical protein n=1 Tax=Streptomyces sp. NPDC127084 TaxID=3347133 RepID=UPI003661C78F
MNVEVKAFDVDATGESLLAMGVTDQEGNYELCFPGLEEDGTGQDVVVAFLTENNLWALRRTGSTVTGAGTGTTSTPEDRVFEWGSEVQQNVSGDLNLGVGFPAEAADNIALETFDIVNDVALWRVAADCWDEKDTVCQQLVLYWSPSSTEGTAYTMWDNAIHLGGSHGGDRFAVAHESAHAIMDMATRVHDDPSDHTDVMETAGLGCPGVHYPSNASRVQCAWLEGFADWVPLSVYPHLANEGFQFESRTWGTPGWDNGLAVEGRVAGALLDLEDAHQDGYWDRSSEGMAHIWYTMQHHPNATFNDFWNARGDDGFDTTSSSVLSTLFQNTIDMGFRDPLTADIPVSRPVAVTPHNFRFDPVRRGWSVIAVRPKDTDHDLRLFDDSIQSSLLGESNMAGSSEVDFVALDSGPGRRPLGDYYPRVPTAGAGTGKYDIEFAEAPTAPLVAERFRAVPMMPGDVASVFNFSLTGERVTVTLTPREENQNGDLYVMCSTGDSGTWVANRAHNVARANTLGPGAVERVTFRASGSCAAVVINKVGKGTYDLLLHVVAPTS